MKFPKITEADIAEARRMNHAEIDPVTVCECGHIQFIHRLGCACGRWIGQGAEHAFIHNGNIIRPDIDFCFIEWQYPAEK